jgi:STE24 endopeptidase
MPTALDNMMKSKNVVLAFGGVVAAAAVYSIWGGDMFPAESDPTGNPEAWTTEELRRWLRAVSSYIRPAPVQNEL